MHRLLLIGVLLLSGCNLFSDNPLSDPAQDAIDSSIIGTWFWNEESDSGYIHIGTDADQKAHLLTMVEFKNDGRIETTEFKGHSTKLSSHRFLNLKWTSPKENDKGYFFMEYTAGPDFLECSFLDAKTFEKAITSGSLKGEVLSPGIMPTVMIHAGQNELRQFIMQNEKSLIADTVKLKKISLTRDAAKNGRVP